MKRLDAGSALGAVTIVGTKYCVGAFDYIIKASRVRDPEEQCLYLVADTKSSDVLLHNGKQRLGMVAASHLDRVTAWLKKLAVDYGADQVIVCRVNPVNNLQEESFRWGSSFNVIPVYTVYERLARKFATKYRKG